MADSKKKKKKKNKKKQRDTTHLGRSWIFSQEVMDDIHIKSELGRYALRNNCLRVLWPAVGVRTNVGIASLTQEQHHQS